MKKSSFNAVITALTAVLTLSMGMPASAQDLKPVPPEQIAKIKAIIPEKLGANPKNHKILVFWRCEGFVHGAAIEYSLEAFKLVQEKYPAYKFDYSREYADLSGDNLKKYDAVVLNNTTHMNTKENFALEYDLIDFVRAGKGLVVIHAGADNFYQAEAAAEMVGGLFDGHPWGAGGTWAFKLDEPGHPINSTFPAPNFKWSDEIYQQKSPYYNRSKLRVLVSLDLSDKDTAAAGGQKREDKDYAVSWIRPYGRGRVFYTSFAHDQRAFLDGAVFGHIVNGLQYALGDLKVDDTPPGLSDAVISAVKDADAVTAMQAFALLQDTLRNTNSEKVNQANVAKLTAILSNSASTPFARQATLRALLGSGIQPAADALVPSLADRETRDWAVTLLAGMEPRATAKIFQSALSSPEPDFRVSVINALVIQKNSAAITPMLADKEPTVVAAALAGLGRIGDKPALTALLGFKNNTLNDTKNTALAACIGTLATSGNAKLAAQSAAAVMKNKDLPAALRAACAKALLINDPTYFATGMKDESPMVRATLIRHADQVTDKQLANALGQATPEDQVAIITKMAAKDAKSSAPAIAKMFNSSTPEVVCAALKAIGKLGTVDQVEAVYAKLSDENEAVRRCAELELNNMLCPQTSAKLIAIAGNDIEKQKTVLKILGERMVAADLKSYTPYITSQDDNVRKDAWKAAGKTADEKSYRQLIAWLPALQEGEVNQAESAIRAALRNVDPAELKTALLKAWQGAAAPAKITLINLMSQYSDDAYIAVISKAMGDADKKVAESAIRVLGAWSNIKPYNELAGALKTVTDPNLKKAAFRGALKQAMSNGGPECDQMCADLFKNAPSEQERETLVTLHYKDKNIETFKFLQQLFNDAASEAIAKQLYVKLYDEQLKAAGNVPGGELDPKKWKAAASHAPGDVKRAFDRNDGSRWSSNAPSRQGMWFSIDLGEASFISEILLDTTGSGNDTPNGYEVFVSNDGKTWSNPVAKGDGSSRQKTKIPMAASGRHIKIVLLDGRPGLHWSIHEMYIKAGVDQNLVKEIGTTADALR
ncbi:MAG: ThuA domain-containing protein [Kiritimatiellae bacterium]|nr:ThuA domain-containing protein [Kiritimatiellia bacterium]